MRVKNLINNSKREREKTKQSKNHAEQFKIQLLPHSELRYNKSDILGILLDFTVVCFSRQRFCSQFSCYQCQQLYFIGIQKKERECEKANIIYRLADCTCSSFTYKITFWPSSQWISAIFFSTLCSFCLVNQKLLLLHMDW